MEMPSWSPAVAALRSPPGTRPSSEELQSILVFGAVLPSMQPQPNLHGGVGRTPVEVAAEAIAAVRDTDLAAKDLEQTGVRMLDAVLGAALTDRQPVVLFSGGVDSSLIAARLKQLGRDDTLLLNYSFGERDGESEVAAAIAKALGMQFERVTRDPSGPRALECPGKVYPVPFGDLSTPPTAELCAAVARVANPDDAVVFDGTGADGAFGLGAKSLAVNRLHSVPRLVLEAGSQVYRRGGWRTNGALEHRLRSLRRLASLTPPAAVVAQNSLFGILYEAPAIRTADEQWLAWLEDIAGRDLTAQIVLADLTLTCAGIFAQKTYGPLRHLGFSVEYPFLSAELAALGVVHTARWPGVGSKQWMKRALARVVDEGFVYRPKSGFIEPEMTLFETPQFRSSLEEALSPQATLAPLLNRHRVRRLVRRADRLGALPHGHRNLLWAVAFIERWLQTSV